MKVLRPVPTFEQVARLPDPVINLPDRVIEVSRPDPNLWDEHEDAVRARAVRIADLRATGVPIDVLRSVMSSAASMAHTDAMEDAASDISSMSGIGAAPPAAPGMPPDGYGPRNQGMLFDGIRAMFADMRGFSERTARAGQDAVIERLVPEIQEAQRRSDFAARLAAEHRPMQDEMVGTL